MEKTYQFKSLTEISKLLMIFLSLAFLSHFALLIFSLETLDWGMSKFVDAVFPFVTTRMISVTLILNGFILIACAITYFIWLYRANSNVHAAGAEGVRSPGWAVGGYFIPAANIALGIDAMREIWKASKSPEGWKNLKTTRLVPIWWGCWLFGNAALLFADSDRAGNLTVLAFRSNARLISYALLLVAIATLVAIVSGISKFQARLKFRVVS